MNSVRKVIALSLIGLSSVAYGQYYVDAGTPETKRVNGYLVDCGSLGEMAAAADETLIRKVVPYNYCKKHFVNMIVQKSKELKEPNFAYGLKLFKVTPYNQKDYMVAVFVDEKKKRIEVGNLFMYVPKASFLATGKDVAKYTKANNNLGVLESARNSDVFCLSNPELGLVLHEAAFQAPWTENKEKPCFKYQSREEDESLKDSGLFLFRTE